MYFLEVDGDEFAWGDTLRELVSKCCESIADGDSDGCPKDIRISAIYWESKSELRCNFSDEAVHRIQEIFDSHRRWVDWHVSYSPKTERYEWH